MRTVILSFSHHGRSLAQQARALGHEIVGVMDAETSPRDALTKEFDCPGVSDVATCLDTAQPDVALVSGKHIEIPSHLATCVERRIPYLVDKPFADCASRLRPVAEATLRHNVFSACTLPNRKSRLVPLVKTMLADGRLGDLVLFGSRLNNGPPSRYDPTPSYWHNDPSVSGGGSWAVEAAHGIDTFLDVLGDVEVEVVGAVMSNAMYGRAFEDWGMGVLRTPAGTTGVIEAGYTYPSGTHAGDHFFRFVGTNAMVFERYDRQHQPIIEIHTTSGIEFIPDNGNGERFSEIIEDALNALRLGTPFEPSIHQAVRILEIQDAVYARARANPAANGPHQMAPAALP